MNHYIDGSPDYVILHTPTREELQAMVNEYMQHGYSPCGGVCEHHLWLYGDETIVLVQAVLRVRK